MFQMIMTTHVAPQVKVSLRMKTRMQAKQSNALLINIHNHNSHLNPENTIITKEFKEIIQTKPQNQSSSNINKTYFYLNISIQ